MRSIKSGLLAECKNVDNSAVKMFLQDDPGEEKNADQSRGSIVRNSVSKLGGLIGHK